ncbi:MAG: hypothetical protein QXW70_01905 [Candidatus Anstonellales archaeon]
MSKTDAEKLIRKKPSSILLLLKNTTQKWHLSKIARQTNTTFVYVSSLITEFQKDGLVETTKEGRRRVVLLTSKGMAIANTLETLFEKLTPPPTQPIQQQKEPTEAKSA